MEPFLENRDEEIERSERRAQRIERMKREKEQQEELRKKIRTYLPLGAGAVGLIIVLITVTVLFAKKQEVNQTQLQPQVEQNSVEETAERISEVESEEETIEEQSSTIGESDIVSYQFETASDVANIYSEEVISSNAILVNADTNEIVASKSAKDRICPASMTKVLTALVAAEHVNKKDLDDTFTMTLEITDYAYVNDCSSVGFLDGEVVTVRDLFYGTILPSGGDAAVGLATYVAGSQEAFVDMMNDKLRELGLAESAHFTNCVGLYDDNHYCTVYDMAVIMKAATENELCKEVLSAHTYTTSATIEHPDGITISNWFLRRIEDKETGGQVLCAKTGYVRQSGSCAASYGLIQGTPYICVTANSNSSWRCIYDQVEIYSHYVPSQKTQTSTEEVN